MQRHPLIMLFDQAKLDNRNDMLAMPIQFTQKPSALITPNETEMRQGSDIFRTDFLQMNSENLFSYLNVSPRVKLLAIWLPTNCTKFGGTGLEMGRGCCCWLNDRETN